MEQYKNTDWRYGRLRTSAGIWRKENYQEGFEQKTAFYAPCGCACVGDGDEKTYTHWCEREGHAHVRLRYTYSTEKWTLLPAKWGERRRKNVRT